MRENEPMLTRRPSRKYLTWAITGLLVGLAWSRLGGLNPESTAIKSEGVYRVVDVIDGDTIELRDGTRVRYIGLDTPEVRKKVAGEWVHDPEPFAQEASEVNKDFVLGKNVRLELDEEREDKYGRTLAYVHLDDGTFVNLALIRGGWAKRLSIPPNQRYKELFRNAESRAQEEALRIWSDHSLSGR